MSMQKVKVRGQRSRSQRSTPNLAVSGLWLQFEFTYGNEIMHTAGSSIEEVPYCFPRSSIKFQGHTGQNITDFDPNWVFPDYKPVAAFKSLRFALFILFSILNCFMSWSSGTWKKFIVDGIGIISITKSGRISGRVWAIRYCWALHYKWYKNTHNRQIRFLTHVLSSFPQFNKTYWTVKLPWIFPGAPMAPGNIQGNLDRYMFEGGYEVCWSLCYC